MISCAVAGRHGDRGEVVGGVYELLYLGPAQVCGCVHRHVADDLTGATQEVLRGREVRTRIEEAWTLDNLECIRAHAWVDAVMV